jgi:signal transduction histidine kinase
LRTPLNAVIGFSEIIERETFRPVGTDKYRDYAHDINMPGQHLLPVINDILDLSKIEFGADDLHEESIDVPHLIRSTLKLVGQRADHRELKIKLDIPSNLPALWADQRKLKQILVNLLSNAIKFTEHGATITIRASCQAGVGYAFQVIDTGIGIAAEDMAKALSRFGQVDSDLNRRYEGSGLGLPLAQAFTEAHGGDFELLSEIGVETTATVRFSAERTILAPGRSTAPSAVPV